VRRGEIYLVNFGKKYNSEFGKIRPALIIQNDIANRNIEKVDFKGVSVIPLTSSIDGGSLRVQVSKRDKLDISSEICINELCTLDITRIKLDNMLTSLTSSELKEVNIRLVDHLGL